MSIVSISQLHITKGSFILNDPQEPNEPNSMAVQCQKLVDVSLQWPQIFGLWPALSSLLAPSDMSNDLLETFHDNEKNFIMFELDVIFYLSTF